MKFKNRKQMFGDMADAILNEDFDEETGEYIGPGDGYPRSLAREAREARPMNHIFGVMNFLKKRGIGDDESHLIVFEFGAQNNIDPNSEKAMKKICKFIQSDFGKFVRWVNENYPTKKGDSK